MLLALRMSNLAVAEQVEVAFGPGLTVLTGETGAGKSILVDALGLLLGGRADPDVVRSGADEAVVEGIFARTPPLAARLEALGLPDLGEEVSLRRLVGRGGRNKAHVNGALVTVGVLGRLMKGLVEIAGQHEHVGLFDASRHLGILDRAADVGSARTAFRSAWDKLAALQERMEGLGGDERRLAERADFLRFQLDELARFEPVPGEESTLEEERRRLQSVERLRRSCTGASSLVGPDEGALGPASRALALLAEAAKLDARLTPAANGLSTAVAELEEVDRFLARFVPGLEADPARLAEVDERLDLLKRLCRKHATDAAGLAARRDSLARELTELDHREQVLASLEQERAAQEAAARKEARALTARREAGARKMTQEVQESLRSLALDQARFEVRVEARAALREDGADHVEFFFSANPGEPPRPLAKVASGGEAARVLLALRAILAGAEESTCEVLDEVDSGVSGAVADVVGRMIRELAGRRQVLCITHLPQVAAHADAHLVVKKRVEEGRTRSEVEPVLGPDRTRELARMLSGVRVSKEALGAAEALQRAALAPPVGSPRGRVVRRALAARETRAPRSGR